MTPKSLFTIILKIFGLIFIRDTINSLPSLIYSIIYLISSPSVTENIINVLINVGLITTNTLLVFFLLFRTNLILEKLELDRSLAHEYFSFENQNKKDQFSIGVSPILILTISFLVIGGIILVQEIPNFCKELYLFYNSKQTYIDVNKPNFTGIIISVSKIIIALLIIGDRDRFINFIVGRTSLKKFTNENQEISS